MSKKLLLALTLALVLVGGSFIGAQAESNFSCPAQFSIPAPSSFPSCSPCARDMDTKPVRDRDCAGNLITPDPFPLTGF